MKVSSEKFSYPLFASHADYFHADRFVLVGDASVGCTLLQHMVLT
ncbi:MAG: hypothetical protein Ct9H300mP6_12560 [Gammaproteobacteria bacterium]|nr:MAG: hypothetical protein Ct9H300mP6_12560 [Gammaproteobacteria bacterium]